MEKWSNYRKPLRTSLILHFLVFGVVLLFPRLPIFQPKVKVVWVNLPRGVSPLPETNIAETKELPKTTIQEQKEVAEKKEEKKPEQKQLTQPDKSKKTPKPAAKPKPKEKTAVEKAMAALEKKVVRPEAAQLPQSGEGFKYGTSDQAIRVPATDAEYIAYQAEVRHKIIQEWIVPLAYLEGTRPPRAKIVVQINQQGEVTYQEWQEHSGNAAFDTSCLRAVQRASPLPLPPERLKWEATNEGFLVEFDPSLKQ